MKKPTKRPTLGTQPEDYNLGIVQGEHVMQHEIVALRCPSCGGGITQPSREMAFGAEFRCDHCGITSVLIVDRALVPLSTLQKQGEKVCTACGRVAQREARFCQEGHPLVRKCIKCLNEFAVDHQRCDACGWPQTTKPNTTEGLALAFDRAVSDLADPSRHVVIEALRVIGKYAGTASGATEAAAVSAILKLAMTPSFLEGLDHGSESNYEEGTLWEALRTLRPAAQQAIPMLQQRIEHIWPDGWGSTGLGSTHTSGRYLLLWCLGCISPDDALRYCRRSLEEEGKNGDGLRIRNALNIASGLGKVAIPFLETFCGLFSGQRGLMCKGEVEHLRRVHGLS